MGKKVKDRHVTFQSEIPVSLEEAFAWHLRQGALERLLPPWLNVTFLQPPARPDEEGGRVGFKIQWGPFSFRWLLEHRHFVPLKEFSDVQIKGPFFRYQHRHHFSSLDSISCKLSEEISYTFPVLNRKIESEFARYFIWRHKVLKDDLKMKDSYSDEPKRILLSGASGFIGSKLKLLLQLCGHEVVRLVRKKEDAAKDTVYWDPVHGDFQKESFEGFDAVIHLAGASIAQGRWTKKSKEQFFLSRCRDTWLLSQVLCRLYRPPKTLICASAIGFYGDRKEELLTEESAQGQGFLADLCQKWEKATESIENRGTRVVHTRFGVVLGAQGGMLNKMLLPFRLGLGGKMGSGKQVISWISIDDLIGGIYHVLMKENLQGPVNLVAPGPVTQSEFVQILAKKVHRPAFFHLPAWVLKLTLGEMAKEMILSSQKVQPEKLLSTGYEFRTPDLQSALDYVM
jgi:uncharacterized protein (TIGR01777 family)